MKEWQKTVADRKDQLANLRNERRHSTNPCKLLAWAKSNRDTQNAKLDRTRQQKKVQGEEIDTLQAKRQGLEVQEAAQASKLAGFHEEVLRLEVECKELDAKTYGGMEGNDEGGDSDFECDGDTETSGEHKPPANPGKNEALTKDLTGDQATVQGAAGRQLLEGRHTATWAAGRKMQGPG